MRLSTAAMLGVVLLATAPAAAQPAAQSQPSDAVVFIRVFATLSAEVDEFRRKVEQRDFELLTGSGFIVSPSGYVLTSHHLIHLEGKTIEHNGRRFEIKATLERIEIVLASGQRLDATVFGSDPELDLAVLTVGGGGLPYLPLGDSDAIECGSPVTAYGYPLGRSIEVGREQSEAVVPQSTMTAGSVSAIRSGDDDQPRFLQVSNALNSGNSGGPILDYEGYAVGVVSMGAKKAAGIAFAVPINRAKDFLERAGLDSALPSRRLGLARSSSLLEKGLRLQMPHGYQDLLSGRLRVEAGDESAGEPTLLINRVVSPRTVDFIERELLAGTLFGGEPFDLDGQTRRLVKGQVSGRALRADSDGAGRTMVYRILSTGAEWIIARYVAPSDRVAFNRAVLRASLDSIEVEPLLRGEPRPPRWRPGGPLPEGWIPEPDPAANVTVVTSPENFAISARYAVWEGASATAIMADLQLPPDRSYKRSRSVAGVNQVLLGQMLSTTQGAIQIELVGPQEHEKSLAQWLREWRTAMEAK